MRRVLLVLVSFVFVVAACGSSDDDGDPSETTEPATPTSAEATVPPDTEPAETEPVETAPPSTAPAETAPEETTGDDGTAGGSAVAVTMSEFEVDTEASLAPGTYTFDVLNEGQFSHEFGVTRGESYESLPLLENGAIDETLLGDDVLGKTELIDPAGTASIDFELEAGTYVFFCNISIGPNSHAANGQVLTVTVG